MTDRTVFSQDNDLLDKRKHCFGVQTESGEDLFFSVELECELLIWEKAFQMATFLEVERIQVRTPTAGRCWPVLIRRTVPPRSS